MTLTLALTMTITITDHCPTHVTGLPGPMPEATWPELTRSADLLTREPI